MSAARLAILLSALVLSGPAWAVYPEDEPPLPTETTTQCDEGQVWDGSAEACVRINDVQLEDQALIQTARELAYAGRFDDTLTLLDRAAVPDSSEALTYRGFAHRSAGRFDLALRYYGQALAADPNNLLARAYLGMGYVVEGRIERAEAQLAQIRARGGAGSWPERALSDAITAGVASGY